MGGREGLNRVQEKTEKREKKGKSTDNSLKDFNIQGSWGNKAVAEVEYNQQSFVCFRMEEIFHMLMRMTQQKRKVMREQKRGRLRVFDIPE